MSRQDSVVKALVDGFEETVVAVALDNGCVEVIVNCIEGYFEVDPNGDITKWPVGLSADLHYWISIDIQCLDILTDME